MFINMITEVICVAILNIIILSWWEYRQRKKLEYEKHLHEVEMYSISLLQMAMSNYPACDVFIPKILMKKIDERKFESFKCENFKRKFNETRFKANNIKNETGNVHCSFYTMTEWNHEFDVLFVRGC